jgi:CDP-diacylglycerol pyrophosphatase
MTPLRRFALIGAAVAAAAIGVAIVATRAADRNALWRIVHEECVPDERNNHSPAPCARVDLSESEDMGVAILKDLIGVAQYLAIPTRRVTGIEAPEVLEPASGDYWRAAWATRSLMEQKLGRSLTRDMVGLAINSSLARSQDQLHIHIDCVSPSTHAALAAYAKDLTTDWRPFPVDLVGHRYMARRLDSPDLAGADPFQLLAEGVDGAKSHMGLETLLVIGMNFSSGPGFALLADRADPAKGDMAHGEDLLDHACAVAQ